MIRNSYKLIFIIAVLILVVSRTVCYPKEVIIAVHDLPPYFYVNEQRGMEYEVLKEAFKAAGHSIQPIYMPFSRLNSALKLKTVDAVATVVGNDNNGIFYSDIVSEYLNVVISLKSRNLKIDKISDLERFSILAFVNARRYLEEEFGALVEKKEDYKESDAQDIQALVLCLGRVDTIITDINIFNHYVKVLGIKLYLDTNVNYHYLFKPSYYKVAFFNKKLRDDFNHGLKTIKENYEKGDRFIF